MPYPNFHSARIKNPDLFVRIVVLQTLPNGVMVYGGPLKSDPRGSGKAQAYRFPRTKFTAAQAKTWLREHNIEWILFEPATGGSADLADPTFTMGSPHKNEIEDPGDRKPGAEKKGVEVPVGRKPQKRDLE